jgi:type IV secretory pathway VirB4 component
VLDEPNGLGWLIEWWRRAFTRWNQPLGADQIDDLRYAFWKAHRDGVRSLRNVQGYIHKDHQNLKTILSYYSDGGFYGHVFDYQGGDMLRIGTNPIGVYELRSLTLLGKLAAAPAIELILHQIINTMDGTPTWLFFDELWWFLQDETSAEFLFDAIGSVRKRGGCFVGATPSTVELANSPFVARLLVNCPGQVFFANHMLRTGDAYVTEQYRQLGVPEHLIATIGSARRKRDLVYKEPEHARLAAFGLGRVGQRICGATGFNDIKRFRQLIATYGNDRDAVLAAWLAD